ncbi:hypothetical protein ABIA69_003375 [Lysinibacillus parviboronicapiens]|uniref:Phage protein n=1 Tax=Lysinibacillus parviboronicapiens TaxID=436516 RepID=A0ABV2PNL3_9BACI
MSKNTVTQEHIEEIIAISSYEVFHRVHGKQCIVVAKLPNGFTVVGESACVDANNYDEQIGFDLAVKHIKSRLWELEGYALQNKLSSNKTLSSVTVDVRAVGLDWFSLLADFIDQVEKCDFKDKHGHDLKMNQSYFNLVSPFQS